MYSIKIVRGNIVNVNADAIVNPANNNLMPGGGANKMIFYATGDRLIEACIKHQYCETGKAVCTPAFGIPAKHIIHAVGPYWHGGYDNEAQKLASCYISIMKIAEELKVKSIAIPALCTGIGKYPAEEAAEIAISSVVSYLQTHELDMDVWFMCYDSDTLLLYRTKMMHGIEDIGKYFERNEIKMDVKLNDDEKKMLKAKGFKKKIITREQEIAAMHSVLKRTIKKHYAHCIYLGAKKTKESINMETCDKYGCSGPFVTPDCVLDFSYDASRMQIRVKPYCFTDTPEELESKRRYFTDEDGDNIPDEYSSAARSSYKQEQRAIKVVNVESLLDSLVSTGEASAELVEVEDSNVSVDDMEATKEGETNATEGQPAPADTPEMPENVEGQEFAENVDDTLNAPMGEVEEVDNAENIGQQEEPKEPENKFKHKSRFSKRK